MNTNDLNYPTKNTKDTQPDLQLLSNIMTQTMDQSLKDCNIKQCKQVPTAAFSIHQIGPKRITNFFRTRVQNKNRSVISR